jgi:hypothetical protein
VLLVLAPLALTQPLAAQSSLNTVRVASGVPSPVFVTAPVGDFSRLFIVQQGGSLRILDLTQNPPVLLATPYLTVTPLLSGGEEGLLGLAFHPDFANNGYFFVYRRSGGNNAVVRFRPMRLRDLDDREPGLGHGGDDDQPPVNSTTTAAGSRSGPTTSYIATGDGGSATTRPTTRRTSAWARCCASTSTATISGRHRQHYANPPTNPFFGATAGLDEIWHIGLRNPWRDSFDRLTGDLWIGDVGQGAIEEVDIAPAGQGGLNFGWRCTEGANCTGLSGCICNGPLLTPSVHNYPHTSGNCTVVGGYRYRGNALCNFGACISSPTTAPRGLTVSGRPRHEPDRSHRDLAPGSGSRSARSAPSRTPRASCTSATSAARSSGSWARSWTATRTARTTPATSQQDEPRLNANGLPDECEPRRPANCFGDGGLPGGLPVRQHGRDRPRLPELGRTRGARLDGQASGQRPGRADLRGQLPQR